MKRTLLFFMVLLAPFLAQAENGSSSTVKSVSYAGNVAFDEEILSGVTGLQKGTTFQAGDERVAAALVSSHYERNGYLVASASASARSADDGWTVAVFVTEGPLYRFGDTRTEGLEKLPERVPRFGAKFRKGDPYVRSLLFDTQSALYGAGFFDDVTISASTTPAHTADVLIRFTERPFKWLKGGVGWGSEERERASLILEHQNLFRRAYRGKLAGTWSSIWREYSAEFINPYFFLTRTEARATTLWRKEYRDGYDFERLRGETSLGRELTKKTDGAVSLRLDRNIVYNLDPNIALTTPERSDARSVGIALNRNSTNDFFFPSRGARTRGSVERYGGVLGGALDLNRVSLESFHYHSVRRWLTAAVAFRGGVVVPYGRLRDVPVFERYFIGGANSVRGYDERDVGPTSIDGSPLGGRRKLGSSVEARFPLFWRLRGALFVDGGQVAETWDGVTPRRWKYSAGGGIRLVTPVGPFRLDGGYKLNRDDGDLETWRMHFSLGESF